MSVKNKEKFNESSKNIVDISLARVASGQVQKELRKEKIKKYFFVFSVISLITIALFKMELNDPQLAIASNYNAQSPNTITLENGDIEVQLKQNKSGHYVFKGEINSKEVVFLLDTGATVVAVPQHIARYLNMPLGEQQTSQTANGDVLVFSSNIKEIKVGGITMKNIRSSVLPSMDMDEILLGMSFLKNVEMIQKDGSMYLKFNGNARNLLDI